MWAVVVEQKHTRKEVARYIYETLDRAREAQRDIRAIRIDQNREQVWVRIVKQR